MDVTGATSSNIGNPLQLAPLSNNHYRLESQQGDRTTWEYHTVSVTRVPGYGFGIAVSGGRDNPHFANGDPSIAVSDVLKGGPAEDRLQVNDRIISVNGVSLENVEYATAVQVLRDSGNTVTLVVKRRVPLNLVVSNPISHQHQHQYQHQHNISAMGLNPLSITNGGGAIVPPNPPSISQPSSLNSSLAQPNNSKQPIKVTLTKNNKKDDYGIVLGCRLFIKEISTKARDQLAANGYTLQEGDVITRIHNTNCGDTMSLKEAKKIIDGCKERLNVVVLRDITNHTATVNALNNISNQMTANVYGAHQPQISNCSNNLDDPFVNGGESYSAQNLYVQPPTRSTINGLNEEKSNLTPRGRSRGPIMEGMSLQQLDKPATPPNGVSARSRGSTDEPPRPPPPRGIINDNEDFYSSRRQLYEDDSLGVRSRQTSEPRFISFQKEGSVGIRLTGGNEAGIFVTAVQPGSPASLQGLTPGDKILKVNDMDMRGVTREEAVLFLLSLQDRIDLIVQYCKEEYDEVVNNQRGDSFHIKTHFHCENPSKGEMAFKAGDVFRVIDTLHNGVVGSWQVLKIGRGHQEMQRGVIPNKSRAEELATAQFNATKKEMNSNESRGNFFRRKRSTHRRSKSLSRENWDDVVFSDSISKFPAYERVVLRHPGFVRPVVIFGPVSDLAREKLTKDFPDKFSTPLQDDDKNNTKSRIVRLSNIRDVMDCGKHALLDITPNAVDRLNYAQFYPIVIFLKTDSKHVIKQLRHGMPKSAHKSSKKLLEQCQKLEHVWSHIFSTQIILNDEESWYRKMRDAIDLQQSGAVWMSETKPVESLSDDFLFPMTTSRLSYASSPESDLELSPGPSTSLSLGNLPHLIKSSSDPSIVTNQDNLDRDRDIIGDGLPPPYTIPYETVANASIVNRRETVDTVKYPSGGGNGGGGGGGGTGIGIINGNGVGGSGGAIGSTVGNTTIYSSNITSTDVNATSHRAQSLYGINAPDLPPRIDRQSKPGSGELPTTTGSNSASRSNSAGGAVVSRSQAQERLFGKAVVTDDVQAEYITRTTANNSSNNTAEALERHHASLERQARLNAAQSKLSTPPTTNQANGSYDSVSSYDSYNTNQLTMQNLGRLGPNAPDDLKSVPNAKPLPPIGVNTIQPSDYGRSLHDHRSYSGANDLNRQSSPGRPTFHDFSVPRNIDPRTGPPQRPTNLGLEGSPRKVETKTDYGKYSRNNSATQADYNKLPKNGGGSQQIVLVSSNINSNNLSGNNNLPSNVSNSGGPFKPVPPPKPKNYRPPIQNSANIGINNQWDTQEPDSPRSPNGFYYPPTPSHHHYAQRTPSSPHQGPNISSTYSTSTYGPTTTPAYNSYNGNGTSNSSHHYNGGSGTGPYIAPHRGIPPPIGNLPPHTPERHGLDLAGSREQRGSAFELYRKPQIGNASGGHHHNLSELEEPLSSCKNNYNAIPQQSHQTILSRPSNSASLYSYIRQQQQSILSTSSSPLYKNVPIAQYYSEHQQEQQQYYNENSTAIHTLPSVVPPPLPPLPPLRSPLPPPLPHKLKKKSVLKSPLTAIKNALIKSTRPLRRMNSVVEPERKPKPKSLRRQHSMLERGVQRPYYPDEYPTYPTGFTGENYYYENSKIQNMGLSNDVHNLSQQKQQQYYVIDNYHNADVMNDTYQNLQIEPLYGAMMSTVPKIIDSQSMNYNRYGNDSLYANRALIDLERRQFEALNVFQNRNGRKIIRRHSTTTADRVTNRRLPTISINTSHAYNAEDMHSTKANQYDFDNFDNQRRAPSSDIMIRRRFYPGAANDMSDIINEPVYQTRRDLQREMQRHHLYQTRKEMQDRISQGKREIEREFSPHNSSQSVRDDKPDKDITHQSRNDVKESALKSRNKLQEQIYQTRRESLDSMAEPPGYIKKRDLSRPEPIYETKEESILQSRENETDENKEGKHDVTILEINQDNDFELHKSSDTIVENIEQVKPIKAPLVQSEDDDLDMEPKPEHNLSHSEISTVIETVNNENIQSDATIVHNDEKDKILHNLPPTKLTENGSLAIENLESSKLSSNIVHQHITRAPFHISKVLKRTAPPPLRKLDESRTSIETQYTSQGSLPVGPPNATSTPYTSNMSLPVAGPVPTSAPPEASIPGAGAFPPLLREPITTQGIFDENGGTLSDNIWNVSLQIPPGAIPSGVKQEIYFTVSDPRLGQTIGGPPLDMENGETMLSPLVMCGPQGLEFLIPVTLNIPHCAGRTTSLGLTLKATDSEKNIHTQWDNIDLPSNAPAHTVSVKVDHF